MSAIREPRSAKFFRAAGDRIVRQESALPSIVSPPGDAHRTAAGMFTISYSCAVAIPTLSGALWDLTELPWMAFVPLGLCAVTLTGLGTMLSRYPSQTE